MNKPEAFAPQKGHQPPKQRATKKSAAELANPSMYEAVLKERRHQVRPIPVAEVKESNSDSDWAKFTKD